jgi:hypothetical protein
MIRPIHKSVEVRMKHLANRKIMSALAVSLCVAVFTYQYQTPTVESCKAALQVDTSSALVLSSLCKPSQQSWFSWLQGNSRSTQFHFFDLLELLNRFDRRG